MVQCKPPCEGFGCEQCQPAGGAATGGTRARQNSPMVNSAERRTKMLKADISTPIDQGGSTDSRGLPNCPLFPKIGGQSTSPTIPSLEEITKLFKSEMGPLKNSMQSLESQMTNLNISVDQKFEKLYKRLDENDVRVQKLEEIIYSGSMTGEMSKEIQMLKDEIEALKGKHVDPGAPMCTAVMGGLSALENLENAKTWIINKM